MKERLVTISIIVILITAVSVIFLHADTLINGPLKNGYTSLSFTTLNRQLVDQSPDPAFLGVRLNNSEKSASEYQIAFFANEWEEKIKVKIPSQSAKTVFPSEEFIQKLFHSGRESNIRYTVKVKWGKDEQELSKDLILVK